MDPKSVKNENVMQEFDVEMCYAFNYSTKVRATTQAEAVQLAKAECETEHSSLDGAIEEITYVSKGRAV